MKEIVLPDDEIIVSKTDTNSHITYGNRLFIEISGYLEKELLGKPHNIIRHPDMPKAVYKLLWETIKSQQEFFGVVKNRCKNGDYYWAFANITASYDHNGRVVGYYSVRRKPSKAQIETLVPIYQQMLAIEQQHSSNKELGMQKSADVLNQAIENLGASYDEVLLKLFN